MVRVLLEGIVREAYVRRLDFATLERVAGQYVSDRLHQRIDDLVWRVAYRMRRWLTRDQSIPSFFSLYRSQHGLWAVVDAARSWIAHAWGFLRRKPRPAAR